MRTAASIIFFLLLVITGAATIVTGNPKPARTITLFFDHRIGDQILELGTPAINIFGETITIERFRYYLSNFSITDKEGKITILPVQYFLVDEADPLSKKIELAVPSMSISSIHFLLGVDSARNVSGIQTGSLDPAKGMFWTWNSGYVMAKLEGTAEVSTSPGHRFTYHVGGFKQEMNATRTISLNIEDTAKQALQNIHITADINRWFKGNTDLRIAATPVCHSPGALAMQIADNYRSLFSINAVAK